MPPVASAEPGVSVDDDGAPNVAFAWAANLTIAALALAVLWQIGKRVLG